MRQLAAIGESFGERWLWSHEAPHHHLAVGLDKSGIGAAVVSQSAGEEATLSEGEIRLAVLQESEDGDLAAAPPSVSRGNRHSAVRLDGDALAGHVPTMTNPHQAFSPETSVESPTQPVSRQDGVAPLVRCDTADDEDPSMVQSKAVYIHTLTAWAAVAAVDVGEHGTIPAPESSIESPIRQQAS